MLEDALAPSYLPLRLPLTGWEVKALWVPLGVWDNLEEMEISVSHSTTGPDLLYIGHESTSAPGKKKDLDNTLLPPQGQIVWGLDEAQTWHEGAWS